MRCTYTYKGVNYTYQLIHSLISRLISLGDELFTLDDIVYSKNIEQRALFDKLKNAKKEFFFKKQTIATVESILAGEPDLDTYSLNNFINSPDCTRKDGTRIVTPLSREDFKKNEIDYLYESEKESGMTLELATLEIERRMALWNQLQNDSFELHLLFTDPSISNGNLMANFLAKANTVLETTTISSVAKLLLYNNLVTNYQREAGKYNDRLTFSNLNISTKLKGLDKDISAHIGRVFIATDGTLHIQLFKTTIEPPFKWSHAKWDNYKLQAAFIKAMVAALFEGDESINTKNATVELIPILLEYDTDNKTIKNTIVYGALGLTDSNKGTYSLEKFDRDVKLFIEYKKSKIKISDLNIKTAVNASNMIFPEVNIHTDGIEKSTISHIKYAPSSDPNGTFPLVITESEDPNYGYDVIINGVLHKVKDKKKKEYNKEIFDLVNAHVTELDSNKTYITQKVKEAIINSYKKGWDTIDKIPGLQRYSDLIISNLSKYLRYTKAEDGSKVYDYSIIDTLNECNVLLFKNNKTGVVDVVSLCTYDLGYNASQRLGDNLLGYYKVNGEYNKLKGTYGNIQAVITLELINEMAKSLDKDIVFGNLSVMGISGSVQYRTYHMGEFNRNYFKDIIKIVNSYNTEKIQYNLDNVGFADPVNMLIEEFKSTMANHLTTEDVAKLNHAGLEELDLASQPHQKAKALLNIMTVILNMKSTFADHTELKKAMYSANNKTRVLANLFSEVCKAYLYITGETPLYIDLLGEWDTTFFTASTVPDPNIRIVVNNLLITHDTIANEFLREYESEIRPLFENFYNQIGYSHFLNATLGNQASQYNNFYERDENGNNLFIFKNPYDNTNNLLPAERDLLKKVLYQIHYIHTNGNPRISKDTLNNNSAMVLYIQNNPEYLWVPLEKASKASQLQSAKHITKGIRNTFRMAMNPEEALDYIVNGIDKFERSTIEYKEEDFYQLSLVNPFNKSMVTTSQGRNAAMMERLRLLNQYGPEYFEYNVENILIDFLAKQITTTQLNKLLVTSKALMSLLLLLGDVAGNKKVVLKEIEYIQNYLKINVFKQSIMDKKTQKVVGGILSAKKVVTDMLLGGNIVGCFRDTIEGAELIFIRSALSINTKIKPATVAKAYAYVWKNSTSDHMKINLLSKLCLKYRLSNTDVGRIAERAKTGRGGVVNYDNWLYSTLRGPDFLNRMTIFVAQCMEDGVWDAFSIDKDGNLKYNWKKDARFSEYAKGNTSSSKYKELKALYYSCVRAYNQDNPEHSISYKEDLPEPYSHNEIQSIRNQGDNIFGSYDRGKKAMVENMAAGISLGMFTTWMNGIYNNYAMKPLENGVTKFMLLLETNDKGELLFYTEDGGITTEDTGLKVYKQVPVLVQGILYTVLDAVKIAKNKSFSDAYEYLSMNPVARANMRKLISDLIGLALFTMLFKGVWGTDWKGLDSKYQEWRASMKNNPVAQNLAVEWAYKSFGRAQGLWAGPLNILQYVGSMNPAWYSVPTLIIEDSYKAIIGEKNWKYIALDNSGFFRSFKDTALAEMKK